MASEHGVKELVAAAQAAAKTSHDRISEVRAIVDAGQGTDTQVADLCAATIALELAAVDLFSTFEARMQHHFRRGPFSRKLVTLLRDAGQTELADKFHQYYLAINVLKHGKGASHRELLNAPNALFVVKPAFDSVADDAPKQAGLVDVTGQGFFDGLSATILEAYQFLESR